MLIKKSRLGGNQFSRAQVFLLSRVGGKKRNMIKGRNSKVLQKQKKAPGETHKLRSPSA